MAIVVVLACGPASAFGQPGEPAPVPPPEAAAEPATEPLGDATAPEAAQPPGWETGFHFGSYGRIGVGTDLRGGTPEQTNVVAHGSRIAEPSYLELDLYYRMLTARGVKVQTVTTLAFDDTLFHYTGEFDAQPALRNLYAEAIIDDRLGLWIGSRMYRGDDIFLLDYWPLDDLNTVGGGAWLVHDRLRAEAHVGANRLLDDYQFQEEQVIDPEFGATTITQLDRQRMIASAKAEYRVYGGLTGPAVKVKGYVEGHFLPEGDRRRGDDTIEQLPADQGLTVGAQVGAWGFAPGRSHVNLFARLSLGLAAFDELAPPMGFDNELQTFPDASELLFGISGNYEVPRGGVLVGGYARRFVDADGTRLDRDDGWEYILSVRPHHSIHAELEGAVDLSYQARFPRGLSPTALVAVDPAVFAVAPMLQYSPFGTGSYDRPQFRLIYRFAHLNEGARDLFSLEDPRRTRSVWHFLGVQAEWWFNSTYR